MVTVVARQSALPGCRHDVSRASIRRQRLLNASMTTTSERESKEVSLDQGAYDFHHQGHRLHLLTL